MIRFLTYLLLFFLPLLVAPLGGSIYETPKVVIGELLIELLFFIALFTTDSFFKKISKTTKFFATFLLTLIIVSSLTSLNLHSLLGNFYRLQGGLLLLHLIILFSLSRILTFKLNPFIPFFTLGLLTISLILNPTNNLGRFVGSLGEPNSMAACSLFLLAWILKAKNEAPRLKPRYLLSFTALADRILKLVSLSLVLLIVLATGSRSGLIGLVIITSFFLLRTKLSFKPAAFIATILIILSLSLPLVFKDSKTGYQFENRAEIWRVSWQAALQKPLLGWGIGQSEQAIHTSAKSLNSPVQYSIVDSSHNIFLDFFLQTGVLGLALFSSLVAVVLLNFIKSQDDLRLSLLFATLTPLLFNPLSVAVLIQFWWILGQGV